MNDLRKTPYTDRIMESTGVDHREALVLETALRWGPDNSWGGNPGTSTIWAPPNSTDRCATCSTSS